MTQPPRPPHAATRAETPAGTPAGPGTAASPGPATTGPDVGAGLRGLRLASGLDAEAFAAALGLSPGRLHAIEQGAAPLPTALLPRLAEALDAPLETVVAELHGVPHRVGELEALAQAYTAIPNPAHREAVLALALALSGEDGG